MHLGDSEWLSELDETYASELRNASLLELGSYNVNGTARDFIHVKSWVGIDIQAGPCVDVVCYAAETQFDKDAFDVVLSSSMLEHDPDWGLSLIHNLQWLKPGGLLLVSWGAEGNLPHPPFPWEVVPVREMHKWASDNNLEVLDARWQNNYDNTPGVYCMVMRKRY